MNDLSALINSYKQWLRETNNRDELYKWEAIKSFKIPGPLTLQIFA
jgi:hypothetical protein